MNIVKPLLAIVAVACSASVLAVPISCDTGIENNITANTGCQIGSTNNDFLNPLQVNVDEMFGFDDWAFAEKEFDSASNIDVGFSVTGSTISGIWSIDNIWAIYEHVMIVMVGGAGNNAVPNYVGYLLNSGDLTGDYYTPFSNASNGNPKDISHFSIYVRGNSVMIAEPSVLLLFAAGCFAMTLLLGRRKRGI